MKKYDTKRIVTLGMLAAIAYVACAVIHIHVVSFLSYEPKDVILLITGLLFGPVDALIVTVLVCLVEFMTISSTGPIGLLMNIISSASFAVTAGMIYQKNRTLKGAIVSVGVGVVVMTCIMMVWNYLITPLYQGVPREVVAGMLIPVFLPFNLIKGFLNAGITLLLYKPVVMTLRQAKLVPGENTRTKGSFNKNSILMIALSVLLIATAVLWLLAINGKL